METPVDWFGLILDMIFIFWLYACYKHIGMLKEVAEKQQFYLRNIENRLSKLEGNPETNHRI